MHRHDDGVDASLAFEPGGKMKIETFVAGLVGIAAAVALWAMTDVLASGAAQAGSSSSEPARSAAAGVFTEAQDQRGAAIYARECSTCHGERLKGGEGAPPLTGPEFSAGWNGQTVGDLFDRIRQTMPAPPERPGKLTPQENADVVAHILSVNGFAAGAAELPTEIERLKRIRIDEPRR
jgi:mono/diheme cytochrome c family protein